MHDLGSRVTVLSDSPVLGHISEGKVGSMGEQCHKISEDKPSGPLCKVLKVNFWRQVFLPCESCQHGCSLGLRGGSHLQVVEEAAMNT